MAPYFPVLVCRSDGMNETITRTGVREINQPSAEQLNDNPDSEGMVDCYRRLPYDDPKAVDWRRKIGGMLMHLLGGKGHADRNYILRELPEGYVLWEHVKYKVDKMAENKRDKGKHAAGLYERQDAYLYGHPQGRRKRYRSPADFFPHVLWLAVDKEGDSRNCSCKICSPDGEDDPLESIFKAETATLKKEIKVLAPVVAAFKASPSKQPAFANTMAPPNKSNEQKLDSEPNGKYLYRPGELVWYDKGPAWGLAIIAKRQLVNDKPQYLVQSLSHPLAHPSYEIKEQERSIRPWLAWSVPDCAHPPIAHLTYEQVPWDKLLRGDFGGGDAVVSASILAAKSIDSSYSLFDRIDNPLAAPGEVHYNGMFLGAEKIWAGEPVRLRVPGDDIVILVIQKLIERTATGGSGPQSTVIFVGDVYKFVEMPMPYRNRSEWPNRVDLPPRVVADLRFRNEVADNAKRGMWYEWRMIETASRKGLAAIKGRWYETRTLLPILRGAEYQQDMSMGITSDVSLWMNGRGDSSSMIGQRKKNRRDTLGAAVPADFKVSRGLDGPPADNLFPDESQISQLQARKSTQPKYEDTNQFNGSMNNTFFQS